MLRPFQLLLAALTVASTARSATFNFTHVSVPAAAQSAIEDAGSIWGGILSSNVAIKVRVVWFPLGSGTLGITFPNGRRDFPGAPVPETWYATALANSITGAEQNPGEQDMDVYLNAATNWYTGLDGMPGPGQYDLVTVAMHELGHGLGFVGLAKKVGSEGSFGMLLPSDFAPLTTSFPWPQLDTLPGIFDRFLRNNAPQFLVDMPNPSTQLGGAFTSNQIYWEGTFGLQGSGGNPVRMYAPASYALGSSCVHLNESTYPAGNPNELMTPMGTPGQANHWPGPIALGIFRDIGWALMPGVGEAEHAHHDPPWRIHPVPAIDVIHLAGMPYVPSQVHISDACGRMIVRPVQGASVHVNDLMPGMYFLKLPGSVQVLRFTKQ